SNHQAHEQECPGGPQAQKKALSIGKRPSGHRECADSDHATAGGDMNATGVLFSFVLDAFGKSFSISQRAHDVGQAVAIADNLHAVERDDHAVRQLMIKSCAEMAEVFTQNDAEEKGDAAHEREHAHGLQVMRAVETANGFAQGVNAIRKREERINSLEESG